MKHTLHTAALILATAGMASTGFSQVSTDTVSTAPGYANQVWYQLEDGSETSAPKDEWDLAFAIDGFSTSIHINSVNGVKLWAYPGTNSEWNSVDTTGLSNWPLLYNSENSWSTGAFDRNINTADMFDVGWGIYDVNTHIITGDSLFIIQLSNGYYKKLDIVNLMSGAFNFRFADLDNSNEVVSSLTKADFSGKNFGYYSLENNTTLDREPLSAEWDLLFTQYTAFIPTAYPVSGILVNNGWQTARASGLTDPANYTAYAGLTFSEDINVIGYDWKSFNMTTMTYDIADDVAYFLQNEDGDVWKIIPTGFGGSTDGNFIFTKEKMATAGVSELKGVQALNIFPNPVSGGMATITFSTKSDETELTIVNCSGQIVQQETINGNGLVSHTFSTGGFEAGIYFVNLRANGVTSTSKLVIQ